MRERTGGDHRNEKKKRATNRGGPEIKKEETLKQAGEIAGPPSKLQLRGFQFPLSPEHRLNTPNAQRHSRGNEADSGGRKRTPKEGNRGLNPALV